MTYFFTSLLQILLPIALLLSCGWPAFEKPKIKLLTRLTLIGFALGILLAPYLPVSQIINLSLNSTIIGAVLLFILSCFFRSQRLLAFWHVLLITLASLQWARNPNISAITGTDVINTDFILNISAVVFGVIFCAFLAVWLFFLIRQTKTEQKLTALYAVLMALIALLVIIPLAGEILLSLMKLQVIELTKARLSFVAKTGKITNYFNYAVVTLLAVSLILFAVKIHLPRLMRVKAESQAIEKRKKMALARHSSRTIRWGAFCLIIMLSSQLYWDKVASRPPQLSESILVKLNADDQIRIPVQQVKDGQLHRFMWVADDGKAVRFFIINRKPDGLSLAAVFDACLLCGDQGYVMHDGQVECVGCGVRMFIPSIGKPGGCNPVPIDDWKQDKNDVIIDRTSLEAGLNLFSTVIEIQVTDPVSGEKLTNTKTEFKYNLDNKTYFFTSEKNLNLFRDNPENYLPKTENQ
ncbi:Fe-S-containing protein [Bisgaard Taxon 10/6]|uniref:Fe-S-containing protein n=1 Tax=Exercitatus varius TaxID=67857 RepID=A0ABT6EQC3_9PAST|nr:Fe-S-containing protein [Exercitatus varius]MDG2939054.1 Fe-S-containing protein [Exercitatus varius]MDG2945749.1 Fe-S-containing protein [Exercitatus varius]